MLQQRKAEEQMDAIKDDLAETKVIMEGRFQAAEETLEVMHRQLSEDLQAGQSSLCKELQEEFRAELLVLRSSEEVQHKKEQPEHLETKSSLSLRPGAPEFILLYLLFLQEKTVAVYTKLAQRLIVSQLRVSACLRTESRIQDVQHQCYQSI